MGKSVNDIVSRDMFITAAKKKALIRAAIGAPELMHVPRLSGVGNPPRPDL